MDVLVKIVYALALAWWTAYFEAKALANAFSKEPKDAEDLAKLDRMRAAFRKLRAERNGGSGPVDPAPVR